jgi:HAMP domain-containing protein
VSDFQQRVARWCVRCFGREVAEDRAERAHRFLEEALELVQACGTPYEEMSRIARYVYGRPRGDVPQEIGQVAGTLALLSEAHGLDVSRCAIDELERIEGQVDAIREKWLRKPSEIKSERSAS